MPKRPCLDCGKLSDNTRCPEHQAATTRAYTQSRPPKPPAHSQRYDWAWRQHSRQLREAFIKEWGDRGLPPYCPGWGHPPHPTTPQDLVVDHDRGVMCRSCNSRKAQQYDKPRKGGGVPD